MTAFAQPPRRLGPWKWEERKKGVLDNANTAGVLPWVQPYGYAAHHEPLADPVRELELLIETQDRDLAPEASILAENYEQAFSLDMISDDQDAEDDAFCDLTTEADDRIRKGAVVYDHPSRREMWLMEQDYQRWGTGVPIIASLTVSPENNLLIQIPQGTQITEELAPLWVNHLASVYANYTYSPDHIREARANCIARQAYYGKWWQLSLLDDDEYEQYKQEKTLYKALNKMEEDIHRDEFVSDDNLDTYLADRTRAKFHNDYAGPAELGMLWDTNEYVGPQDDLDPPWLNEEWHLSSAFGS